MTSSHRADRLRATAAPTHSVAHLDRLTDAQLLELVIGQTRGEFCGRAVRRLLELTASLDALARLSPEVLREQAGLLHEQVVRLLAAFELGRRRWSSHAAGVQMDSLACVVAWARPRLLPLDHEEVWLLSLDGRNALRNCRRIAQGGTHGCALTARDILRPALRDGATAIILVHNHPSGDPTPSMADVEMTAEVDVACAAIGLTLLDHVVVATSGAVSLLELGVVHAR